MSFIKDISENEFLQEVVEKSQSTPVLVDFWAPWCGPCKQLTPLLEKLVNKQNGKIILVKINIDENKELSTKLNIQSVPTVYAFSGGKPIDAFQGAQSEDQIQKLIVKLLETAPGNEIPKLLEEAQISFKDEQFEDSLKIYERLIGMDSLDLRIISGLLRCYYQLGRIDTAIELYESLNDEIINDEEIKKLKKLLYSSKGDPVDVDKVNSLKNDIVKDPKNKEKIFELAGIFLNSQNIQEGFDALLEIYKQDPKWKEQQAKLKLLEYFDILGPMDSNVIIARKKLSSMMFK